MKGGSTGFHGPFVFQSRTLERRDRLFIYLRRLMGNNCFGLWQHALARGTGWILMMVGYGHCVKRRK